MPKKKEKPVDPDLATWIRLGEGVPPEDDDSEGLTEGERIMRAGNEWVRTQLMSSTLRMTRNPFRRE